MIKKEDVRKRELKKKFFRSINKNYWFVNNQLFFKLQFTKQKKFNQNLKVVIKVVRVTFVNCKAALNNSVKWTQ